MSSKTKQEELHDKIKHNILVPFATYQDPMHRAQLLFEQGAVTGDDYGYGITVERIEKLINSEVLAALTEIKSNDALLGAFDLSNPAEKAQATIVNNIHIALDEVERKYRNE